MTDRKSLVDPNDTPEDVATLYSWANLHGAKYRDFSASRAQTREKARQRVQDAMDAERRRTHDDAEAQKAAEVLRASDAARNAEAQRQADIMARDNAVRAERQAAEMAAAQQASQSSYAAQRPQQMAPQVSAQYAWQPGAPPIDVSPASHPPAAPAYVPPPSYAPAAPSYATPVPQPPPPQTAPSYFAQQPPAQTTYQPAPQQQTYSSVSQPTPQPTFPQQAREEHYLQNRAPAQWTPPDPRENGARPAWLMSDRTETAPPPAVPQAPEDTLQASRDRLTSRWFALKGVFSGNNTPQVEVAPVQTTSRAPVLAVFSLAGGVGKTSLVATLGRALSARGERVLLVDTAAFGLLPFFFGARDQRPGVLRTFTPPGVSGDAPIQMLTVDPDTLGPENAPQETLTQEISRNSRSASRVMVDLATASGAITRRVLRMAPTVLVPVIPDMSSVVSVGSIDAFFQRNVSASGQPIMPFYILNQFDPSLPLHLDVREVLREQLGDRLLPFALRRTPAVSEALAEGMTVVDYAPNSTVAEDFGALAAWVKSLAAPATNGFRGVRWSER
jgi:cellulose synthase operon protein YhjQ